MTGLREMIDLVWLIKNEEVMQKVEMNTEYQKQKAILNIKEELLISILAPEQRKWVTECSETSLQAYTLAAQDIYREGFLEGLKIMARIADACKSA